MSIIEKKCVMILDEALPPGLIANTSAIIGITLGKHVGEQVGQDVHDKSGHCHLGITTFPIPIVKADPEQIHDIRSQLYSEEYEDMLTVDFTGTAQSCNDYMEYAAKLAETEDAELRYLGIGIYGNKKKVNKLTGGLKLLR